MFDSLSFNPKKTTDSITDFIKKTFNKTGFSKAVMGLSGGLDSSVVAYLTVKALGEKNVYIGLFPYGDLNKEGLEDAQSVIDQLKIPHKNVTKVDIKPVIDALVNHDKEITSLRKGNLMARTRMMLLFDLAKKYKALVAGTENKTEKLLGYFTRFGDEASDIEPISHLYKTQVITLAKYLKVSNKIIQKPPSAGLWSGQTDEGEFGFTYGEADKILNLFIDKKKTKKQLMATGLDPSIVNKVLHRYSSNRFKQALPYKLEI